MQDKLLSDLDQIKSSKELFLGGITCFSSAANAVAHCDLIYSFFLVGKLKRINFEEAQQFCDLVAASPLFGRKNASNRYTPHLSAYLLGGVKLLSIEHSDLSLTPLTSVPFDLDSMIDHSSNLPYWPTAWSHHSWRVSHWVAGIPAMFLQLSSLGAHDNRLGEQLVANSNRSLIDQSGFLKCFKSSVLQASFRTLYQIKHNPRHGDVGGITHLHWLNHVLGNDYPQFSNVAKVVADEINKQGDYIEVIPYCLDFDYFFLARSGKKHINLDHLTAVEASISRRAKHIANFLFTENLLEQKLHNLPGSLACLHEAALFNKLDRVENLNMQPLDIINQAYWL